MQMIVPAAGLKRDLCRQNRPSQPELELLSVKRRVSPGNIDCVERLAPPNAGLVSVSKGLTPFKFPAGAQLAPGAAVRVVSGQKVVASGPGEYLWRATYIWCNEGDAATLLDPEGTIADRFFYGKPVDLLAGKTPCSR